VIVAHGGLAEGFLSALTRVAGPQENLWPLSNEALSGEALMTRIEELLDERAGGREVFVFTDLDAGSCGLAGRRLLADERVRAVFFGVNLPLLIEFVFLQAEPLEKLVPVMIAKSRAALGVRP
jgi:PTS system mannose-specific IIA component/PTS system mannose-specific IIB component